VHDHERLDAGFDAVLLGGGAARRLGGVVKPALEVGGRPMLARVRAAVVGAERVVLVGPPPPDEAGLRLAARLVEDPPGGGPVAALAAGIGLVDAPLVAVLAADLPFLTASVIDALRTTLIGTAGARAAVLIDESGREQLLVAVWRTDALREALCALDPPSGRAMRELYAGRQIARCRIDSPAGAPVPWFDCDTEADLAQARAWA
jgi:molybdenum cofactor guanylyltransferase